MKLMREHVMPALAAIGPLRDAMRRTVSELSIQYRRSPLTLERLLDGGPRAGERAPDARVHVVDGPLGRAPGVGCLFDLHDPAFFSLFLLVTADGADDIALAPATITVAHAMRDPGSRRLAAQVERVLPNAVRIWRITDITRRGRPSLTDNYGRTRPSFYLRAAGRLYRARGRAPSDVHGLLRHCETWFTAADTGAERPLRRGLPRALSTQLRARLRPLAAVAGVAGVSSSRCLMSASRTIGVHRALASGSSSAARIASRMRGSQKRRM